MDKYAERCRCRCFGLFGWIGPSKRWHFFSSPVLFHFGAYNGTHPSFDVSVSQSSTVIRFR
jgi:hypothetical protein